MGSNKKLLLSLDGGGIRGVFTASFLAHLEKHLEIHLVDELALVSGTSTGAIVGLALAAGIPAKDILSAYKEAGPLIFGSGRSRMGRWLRAAHDNDELVRWLRSFFGSKTLDEAKVPVAIPTLDVATGSPRVYKSNHHPELHAGGDMFMWEVALASAAAPTYFPAVQVGKTGAYLDGGLWANNPAIVAALEAMVYLDIPREHIHMLSVATGRRRTWFELAQIRNWGKLQWATNIVDLVFDAQAVAIDNQAKLLMPQGQYLRVNMELPRQMLLDDVAEITQLENLGVSAGLEYFRVIKELIASAGKMLSVAG